MAEAKACEARSALDEEASKCETGGNKVQQSAGEHASHESGRIGLSVIFADDSICRVEADSERRGLHTCSREVTRLEEQCEEEAAVERLPSFGLRRDEENKQQGYEHHAEADSLCHTPDGDMRAVDIDDPPGERRAEGVIEVRIHAVRRCEEDDIVKRAVKSVDRQAGRRGKGRDLDSAGRCIPFHCSLICSSSGKAAGHLGVLKNQEARSPRPQACEELGLAVKDVVCSPKPRSVGFRYWHAGYSC